LQGLPAKPASSRLAGTGERPPSAAPWYGRGVRDPYDVLGVGKSASEADIKSAFRRQAALHHPDRNPNDPEAATRFKELNQAHEILKDPQKRAAWDRYGEAAFRPGGGGPGGPGVPFVDLGGFDGIFGDILEAFGIRGGDRGSVRQKLTISFEEAAQGCTKELEYDVVDACHDCGGRGAAAGTPVSTCVACNGRGRVRFQQAIFPIAVERMCSRCRGTGQIPSTPCKRCSGAGLEKRKRKAEIDIPPGIESGSSRLVEGAGNRVQPDKPAGPLEVVVEVAEHPFFRREADDVVCAVPISFAQAALGGEVDVPTLDGKVKLRVPPATQPGSVLRIKGKGIPHRIRGGRGDQLVEVSVEVPTHLSDRAKELIEELGREMGEDVQPQQKTFVEKLKSLFG
jgi:molecular chaperone DnaJ